ncbi:MAG: hypothetical protein CL610_02555 [Anaerolineaceae bacterium]|nr:hypothetical protein [Anaerolineaceae bacterium]
MKCIFCKEDSSSSKSIEHIIPESLGNTEHVLPPSVVCEKCNNYFARKIEKPFLESPFIVHLRNRQEIVNKRGIIPPRSALYLDAGIQVNIDDQDLSIYPSKESDVDRFITTLLTRKRGTLISLLHHPKPDSYLTARFIGKIAIEALAHRFIQASLTYEEIIENKELDPLRSFVRYGNSSEQSWEYNEREIYIEDKIFHENGSYYQLLHEFMFLQMASNETIFIIAFFGTEYAMSLDRNIIQGYRDWLAKNHDKSPLYP